jgi:hypothetical protein
MRKGLGLAGIVLLLLALFEARASAQNLVTNGGFATDFAGWSPTAGATPTWTAEDATGASGSGSVRIVNGAAAAGTIVGLFQCLPVRAGVSYGWGGSLKVTAPSGVSAFVTLSFFGDGSCGGAELARASTNSPLSNGWEAVATKSVTAPAGASSARILLAVQKAAVGGTAQALFDDAFVDGPPATTVVVPASASVHGQNGAFFHTDLWLVNRSYTAAVTVSARFRCYSGQSCPATPTTIPIPSRGTVTIADVVGTLFASPETAGAIELSWDATQGPVTASSRTYTPSLPAPTFGTGVPALDASEAGVRWLFPGLGNNGGSLAAGFRTNAGAYNPGDTPAHVTMSLFSAAGALGAPFSLDLAAREARQINDVFGTVGAGSTVTTGAYLVVSSDAPVFPYAIVIDNKSGDSVFVPGSPDEAPPVSP